MIKMECKLEKENKEKIKKLVKIAKSLIGKKYKYGAKPEEAPEYFDCSSFIQYLFKQINIQLPRCSIEQIEYGKSIELEDIKPGDLVFFKGGKFHVNERWPNGVGHVALYIGKGKIIHAFGNRKQVCISNLKDMMHYELRAIKRILE